MKQLRTLFLTLLLCMGFSLAGPMAHAAEGSGWQLDETTGVLTLTENVFGAPWIDYKEQITKVVYQEPEGAAFVKFSEVPQYAFVGYPNLKEVVLPPYLVTIGSEAFVNCTALEKINIPDPVREIGASAFAGCSALETVEFSRSITPISGKTMTIGYGAFRDCTALRSVDLPVSCGLIGAEAFAGCTALEQISITETVSLIQENAFLGCTALRDIYFEGSEEQWRIIGKHSNNTELNNAAVHGHSGPFYVFDDVGRHEYYFEAVVWALQYGVTTGTSAGNFSPDESCTRGQVVTFLWRAMGSPAPEGKENPFTDVAPDAYYHDAVLWAVEQGITSGTSATEFSPDALCTRAHVVTFLWRLHGQPEVGDLGNPFGDITAADYYYDAVLWAVSHGITRGIDPVTFAPHSVCSRAQVVTFLHRGNNI